MNALGQSFLHLLRDAGPWFVVGALLGAAMQAFLKPAWVLRWLGSQRTSVFNAAVGTCIPTIAMAPRVIGRAATYVYVAAWLVLSIGAGMLLTVLT